MAENRENRPGHAGALREAYVDAESLDARAASWLEAIEPYTRRPFSEQPKTGRPTLLVMDMQRFFLEESAPAFLPAGAAVLPRVRELVESFRERRLPVIFTRHVDRSKDRSSPMVRWWSHGLAPDDPLAELTPGLRSDLYGTVLVKQQYSAFCGTRLEMLLRRFRASQVVVTGVMTHLCCESTARDAFMRGFEVLFVVDATATLNEVLHLSSIRGRSHGFAVPALTRSVICGLTR